MSAPPTTVVLHNEAVQALLGEGHRKHRNVLACLEAVNQRRRRGTGVRVVIPVAVRVEAGWDRTHPQAANANRISAAIDVELRRDDADRAVQLRRALDVSVADATVGAAAESVAGPVAILTSDVGDMERLAGGLAVDVRVVGI